MGLIVVVDLVVGIVVVDMVGMVVVVGMVYCSLIDTGQGHLNN